MAWPHPSIVVYTNDSLCWGADRSGVLFKLLRVPVTATEVLNQSPAVQTGLICHTDYQHICMPAGSLWDQIYLRPTIWVLRPTVMMTWMWPNYFGISLKSKRLAIILSPAKKTKMVFATLRGFNCLLLFIIPCVSVWPRGCWGLSSCHPYSLVLSLFFQVICNRSFFGLSGPK